jgi:hypothetical protein
VQLSPRLCGLSIIAATFVYRNGNPAGRNVCYNGNPRNPLMHRLHVKTDTIPSRDSIRKIHVKTDTIPSKYSIRKIIDFNPIEKGKIGSTMSTNTFDVSIIGSVI